ncbi:MAG: hypothetical protein ACD_17C00079G0001 [uncultured bacterium]|nr:MAG: hypothetical protein ACD_17C00079G0001 [uncultured bacterium]
MAILVIDFFEEINIQHGKKTGLIFPFGDFLLLTKQGKHIDPIDSAR